MQTGKKEQKTTGWQTPKCRPALPVFLSGTYHHTCKFSRIFNKPTVMVAYSISSNWTDNFIRQRAKPATLEWISNLFKLVSHFKFSGVCHIKFDRNWAVNVQTQASFYETNYEGIFSLNNDRTRLNECNCKVHQTIWGSSNQEVSKLPQSTTQLKNFVQ